MPVFNQENKWM